MINKFKRFRRFLTLHLYHLRLKRLKIGTSEHRIQQYNMRTYYLKSITAGTWVSFSKDTFGEIWRELRQYYSHAKFPDFEIEELKHHTYEVVHRHEDKLFISVPFLPSQIVAISYYRCQFPPLNRTKGSNYAYTPEQTIRAYI